MRFAQPIPRMKTGDTFPHVEPCVATIGFFDGVHRGHRYLIDCLRRTAFERGMTSAVVTFTGHPCKVVHADRCPELLTTCREKVELLEQTGLDYCFLLDFTPRMAALTALEFLQWLKDRYAVRVLLVGYDHHFGHGRGDTFADYVRYGCAAGVEVLPAPGFSGTGEQAFSSSMARRLLKEGRVDEAACCLGYDYFLQGTVVEGHRVGRTIGYPTANLQVDAPDKLVPADGVYAVRALVNGQQYGGMLGIGCRPTLDNGTDRSIETHLLDFHADIYHQPMRISFVRRIRPEMKFASVDCLAARLHQDEAEARAILSL